MPHCTHWMVPLACAALLGGMAGAAHAGRGSVSVGVNVGVHGGYGGVQVGAGRGWHGGPGYRPGYGRGYYGGGYRGYSGWGGGWGSAWGGFGPSWVYVAPPLVFPLVGSTVDVFPQQTVVVQQPAALPVAPSRPDPVIYPRNNQSAQQTEFDRQDCNRWATTQPAAMADASVFHRAVEACMDGRGYTLK